MQAILEVDIECNDPACSNSTTVTVPITSFTPPSDKVGGPIVGATNADIAVNILGKGWVVKKIGRKLNDWSFKCFRHGISPSLDKKIKSMSEENDWSEEFTKGFREAIARHPEIDKNDL